MAASSDNLSPFQHKTPWHWFEREAIKKSQPTIPTRQIDNYLDRRWKELPEDFKTSQLPALTDAHHALEHAANMQNLVNNTMYASLAEWTAALPDQLDARADSFATVDERLTNLKLLREARNEVIQCMLDLARVRAAYPQQHLLSAETAEMVRTEPGEQRNKLTPVDREIAQLEVEAPLIRQKEATWRQVRRDRGMPGTPGWAGGWVLASGSYGTTVLWLRQNHHGQIIDRLVVKDAEVSDAMIKEDEAWVLSNGVYIPSEVWAPNILRNQPGSDTIVRVRGWREMVEQDKYRILMDYYPYGDLWELRMKEYRRDEQLPGFKPRLPEPFLWYVFENLATAGVLMQQGALNPQGLQAWSQIYHSDIKLSNVMLGPENPDKYSGYPTPVLVDWGFALFNPPGELRAGRGGTPGCQSPENMGPYISKDGVVTETPALTAESDVWSVGNIIWGLMRSHEADDRMDFHETPEPPREPDLRELRGEYSDEIIDLVARAMRYHPEDRIGFPELLKQVQLLTGDHPDPKFDLTQGLRLKKKAGYHPDWRQPNAYLRTKWDQWRLFTYPNGPLIPTNARQPTRPPHHTRRLSSERPFNGPRSGPANNPKLARQRQRHLESHTRVEHLLWLQNRRGTVNKGTFAVPDSDDDWSDDEGDEQAEAEGPAQQRSTGSDDSWFYGDDAAAMNVPGGPARRTRSQVQVRRSLSAEGGAQGEEEQQTVPDSPPAQHRRSFNRRRTQSGPHGGGVSKRRRSASPR